MQFGKLGVPGIGTADARQVGTRVFHQIIFQGVRFFRRASGNKRPVVFPEFMAGKLPVQFLCGGGSLGEYKDPPDRLIQTVDDGKVRLASLWRTPVDMVLEDADQIGIGEPSALDGGSAGFVAYQDMLVFIQDLREIRILWAVGAGIPAWFFYI